MSSDNQQSDQEFGANQWLVEEMYAQWLANPDSVDKEWLPIMERFHAAKGGSVTPTVAPTPVTGSIPLVAKTTKVEPQPTPIPAQPVRSEEHTSEL